MRPFTAAIILILTQALLAAPRATETLDIAPVWAGHPVRFSLLTVGQRNFVAFYDAERQMTVASRTIGDSRWTFAKLNSRVGWDSHNSLTLAADSTGHLHLAGNMHVVPLVYFRTTRPGDVTSFERLAMTGQNETRCTYPVFFRGPADELMFMYRDGRSGNGNQIFNAYDPVTRQWRRLLDQPLTDGEGKCNAYFVGPTRGPDGWFHLVWTWRDTPDCSTNHDVCYARSKDLVHWETSTGKPLTLPMTRATAEMVEAVPVKGGILNGNTLIGFDTRNRVVITYHKYDADGNTQIYNARHENGAWKIRQASQWDYRWEFSGGGTIGFELRPGPVRPLPDGTLVQSYHNPRAGSGAWKLDPETLAVLGPAILPATTPAELNRVRSDFPGMRVNWAADTGNAPEAGARFALRWETLGANRDRPRPEPWPKPSILQLIKIVDRED